MYELVTVNPYVMEFGLLDLAKEHLRVEFDRDDEFIKSCVKRAVREVESQTNAVINPATYLWHEPTPSYNPEHREWEYRIDKNPVRRVYWMDNLIETDLPTRTNGLFTWMQKPPSDEVYIEAGFEEAIDIQPEILSVVLMYVAAMYENREAIQQGRLYALPNFDGKLMTGIWRPSA